LSNLSESYDILNINDYYDAAQDCKEQLEQLFKYKEYLRKVHKLQKMPTLEEITELENKCSKEHSKLNGVEGWYFTGPNGNKIFLPSAGYKDESNVSYDMKDWRGAACMYWSGDLITYLNYLGDQDGSEAFSISFDNKGVPFGNYFSRCTGLTVRPVTK